MIKFIVLIGSVWFIIGAILIAIAFKGAPENDKDLNLLQYIVAFICLCFVAPIYVGIGIYLFSKYGLDAVNEYKEWMNKKSNNKESE